MKKFKKKRIIAVAVIFAMIFGCSLSVSAAVYPGDTYTYTKSTDTQSTTSKNYGQLLNSTGLDGAISHTFSVSRTVSASVSANVEETVKAPLVAEAKYGLECSIGYSGTAGDSETYVCPKYSIINCLYGSYFEHVTGNQNEWHYNTILVAVTPISGNWSYLPYYYAQLVNGNFHG